MDTRADFQRLLEDMDRVIRAKRQELSELEERLESSRSLVGEREASELRHQQEPEQFEASINSRIRQQEPLPEEQRRLYEQQLERFAEELHVLESANQELGRENELLRNTLQRRQTQLAEGEQKWQLSAASLAEVQAANLELNLRLARSESELQKQTRLLERLHTEDELLMRVFSNKLELLGRDMEAREHELSRSAQPFADELGLERLAGESAGESKVLLEREKLLAIAAAIRDKDAQLEQLKAAQVSGEKAADEQQPETAEKWTELEARCRMLESELDSKDRQLHLAEFKNHQYEIVMPNKISDLVQKLIQFYYRKSSELREEDFSETIELLINNLNRLLAELNSAQGLLYKIDQLREESQTKGLQIERLVSELNQRLNGDHFNGEKLAGSPAASDFEHSDPEPALNQNANAFGNQNQSAALAGAGPAESECQQQVSSTQSEPARPPAIGEQTSESNLNHSSLEGSEMGKVAEASQQSEAHSELNLESGHQSVMMGGEMIERSINEPAGESRQENGKAGESEQQQQSEPQSRGERERSRRLEAENELLELAMKEILSSIKWTDGQCCTLLIDCPSLERLCQLIEARHIAGKPETPVDCGGKFSQQTGGPEKRADSLLFQLVLLKSELDLVRGQNEQLRAELKVQRRDYVEYLSNAKISAELAEQPASELQCQTGHSKAEVQEPKEAPAPPETPGCRNCDRLHQLINHLLESIERIQGRVQASEDNYTARLANLHKLVEVFEKDLAARERMLAACRRQCSLLLERKLAAESQLQLYESKQRQEALDCSARKPAACRPVILFNNNNNGHASSAKRQRESDEIIFDSSSDEANSFSCS